MSTVNASASLAYTQAFKDSLFDKVESLPLVQGIKEYVPESFDVTKASDPAYIMAFASRVNSAKEEHEKVNQLPSSEGMLRRFTLSLLAEIFSETEVSDFPTAFNQLKDETIKELNFLHYSVGEFGDLLIKSLKTGNAFAGVHLARIKAFQDEVIDNDVNFVACCKKHKITKSFATVLKDNPRIQSDRLGQTKEERESSTMTAQEAIEAIGNGDLPYAPPAPKPSPEPKESAKSSAPKAPKGKK